MFASRKADYLFLDPGAIAISAYASPEEALTVFLQGVRAFADDPDIAGGLFVSDAFLATLPMSAEDWLKAMGATPNLSPAAGFDPPYYHLTKPALDDAATLIDADIMPTIAPGGPSANAAGHSVAAFDLLPPTMQMGAFDSMTHALTQAHQTLPGQVAQAEVWSWNLWSGPFGANVVRLSTSTAIHEVWGDPMHLRSAAIGAIVAAVEAEPTKWLRILTPVQAALDDGIDFTGLLVSKYGGTTFGDAILVPPAKAVQLAGDLKVQAQVASPPPLPAPKTVISAPALPQPVIAQPVTTLPLGSSYDPYNASQWGPQNETSYQSAKLAATPHKMVMRRTEYGDVVGDASAGALSLAGSVEWRRIGNRLEMWSLTGDEVNVFVAHLRAMRALMHQNPKIDSLVFRDPGAVPGDVAAWLAQFQSKTGRLLPDEAAKAVKALDDDLAAIKAMPPATAASYQFPLVSAYSPDAIAHADLSSSQTFKSPKLAAVTPHKTNMILHTYTTGQAVEWRRLGNRLEVWGASAASDADMTTALLNNLRRLAAEMEHAPAIDQIIWKDAGMLPQALRDALGQFGGKESVGAYRLQRANVLKVRDALEDDIGKPAIALAAPTAPVTAPPPAPVTSAPPATPPTPVPAAPAAPVPAAPAAPPPPPPPPTWTLAAQGSANYDPVWITTTDPTIETTITSSKLNPPKDKLKIAQYDVSVTTIEWRRNGNRLETWAIDASGWTSGSEVSNTVMAHLRRMGDQMEAAPLIEYLAFREPGTLPFDVRDMLVTNYGAKATMASITLNRAQVLALRADLLADAAKVTGVPVPVSAAPTPPAVALAAAAAPPTPQIAGVDLPKLAAQTTTLSAGYNGKTLISTKDTAWGNNTGTAVLSPAILPSYLSVNTTPMGFVGTAYMFGVEVPQSALLQALPHVTTSWITVDTTDVPFAYRDAFKTWLKTYFPGTTQFGNDFVVPIAGPSAGADTQKIVASMNTVKVAATIGPPVAAVAPPVTATEIAGLNTAGLAIQQVGLYAPSGQVTGITLQEPAWPSPAEALITPSAGGQQTVVMVSGPTVNAVNSAILHSLAQVQTMLVTFDTALLPQVQKTSVLDWIKANFSGVHAIDADQVTFNLQNAMNASIVTAVKGLPNTPAPLAAAPTPAAVAPTPGTIGGLPTAAVQYQTVTHSASDVMVTLPDPVGGTTNGFANITAAPNSTVIEPNANYPPAAMWAILHALASPSVTSQVAKGIDEVIIDLNSLALTQQVPIGNWIKATFTGVSNPSGTKEYFVSLSAANKAVIAPLTPGAAVPPAVPAPGAAFVPPITVADHPSQTLADQAVTVKPNTGGTTMNLITVSGPTWPGMAEVAYNVVPVSGMAPATGVSFGGGGMTTGGPEVAQQALLQSLQYFTTTHMLVSMTSLPVPHRVPMTNWLQKTFPGASGFPNGIVTVPLDTPEAAKIIGTMGGIGAMPAAAVPVPTGQIADIPVATLQAQNVMASPTGVTVTHTSMPFPANAFIAPPGPGAVTTTITLMGPSAHAMTTALLHALPSPSIKTSHLTIDLSGLTATQKVTFKGWADANFPGTVTGTDAVGIIIDTSEAKAIIAKMAAINGPAVAVPGPVQAVALMDPMFMPKLPKMLKSPPKGKTTTTWSGDVYTTYQWLPSKFDLTENWYGAKSGKSYVRDDKAAGVVYVQIQKSNADTKPLIGWATTYLAAKRAKAEGMTLNVHVGNLVTTGATNLLQATQDALVAAGGVLPTTTTYGMPPVQFAGGSLDAFIKMIEQGTWPAGIDPGLAATGAASATVTPGSFVPPPPTPAAPKPPSINVVVPVKPKPAYVGVPLDAPIPPLQVPAGSAYVIPSSATTAQAKGTNLVIPDSAKLSPTLGYDPEQVAAMSALGYSEVPIGQVTKAQIPQNAFAARWVLPGGTSVDSVYALSPSGSLIAYTEVANHGGGAKEVTDATWAGLLAFANRTATLADDSGTPTLISKLYVTDDVLAANPAMRDLLLRHGGEDIRVRPASGQGGGFFDAYGPGIRLDRDQSTLLANALRSDTEDVTLQGQWLANLPPPVTTKAVPTGVVEDEPYGYMEVEAGQLWQAGNEVISASGLRAVSTWANGKVESEWLKTGTILEWKDLRLLDGPTEGQVRASVMRTLDSLLENIGNHPGMVLEVDEAVYAVLPDLRDLLIRYRGREASTSRRTWIRLNAHDAAGLRMDMDSELGSITPPGFAGQAGRARDHLALARPVDPRAQEPLGPDRQERVRRSAGQRVAVQAGRLGPGLQRRRGRVPARLAAGPAGAHRQAVLAGHPPRRGGRAGLAVQDGAGRRRAPQGRPQARGGGAGGRARVAHARPVGRGHAAQRPRLAGRQRRRALRQPAARSRGPPVGHRQDPLVGQPRAAAGLARPGQPRAGRGARAAARVGPVLEPGPARSAGAGAHHAQGHQPDHRLRRHAARGDVPAHPRAGHQRLAAVPPVPLRRRDARGRHPAQALGEDRFRSPLQAGDQGAPGGRPDGGAQGLDRLGGLGRRVPALAHARRDQPGPGRRPAGRLRAEGDHEPDDRTARPPRGGGARSAPDPPVVRPAQSDIGLLGRWRVGHRVRPVRRRAPRALGWRGPDRLRLRVRGPAVGPVQHPVRSHPDAGDQRLPPARHQRVAQRLRPGHGHAHGHPRRARRQEPGGLLRAAPAAGLPDRARRLAGQHRPGLRGWLAGPDHHEGAPRSGVHHQLDRAQLHQRGRWRAGGHRA